jgi:trigger factor
MKVEIEDLGNMKYRLAVEVDPESFAKARVKLARNYAPHVNLKGFRPGKAPIEMVMRQMGAALDLETREKLVSDTMREKLTEKGLKPSTEPKVEFKPDAPDGTIAFTAEFESLPQIELKDYLGVSVVEPEMPAITDEAVEEAVGRLQRSATHFDPKPEDGVGHEGDIAVCEVEVKDEAGTSLLKQAESRIVVGLDDEPVKEIGRRLLGMHAGETATLAGEPGPITVRGISKAAGGAEGAEGTEPPPEPPKTVSVELKVKQVLAKVVPPLDDELAKKVGAVDTVAELRAKVRERLEAAREDKRKGLLREAVVDAVVKANPIALGSETVTRVAASALEEAKARIFPQMDPEDLAKIDLGVPSDKSEAEARRNLERSLILNAVAEKEGIEVTAEDVEGKVAALAAETGLPLPRVRAYLAGEQGEEMRRRLRVEKTLEILMRYAVVTPASEAPAEGEEPKVVLTDAETPAKSGV